MTHFRGKADSTGLTQINCSFKTIAGNDFIRSASEVKKLLREFIQTDGQQRRKLKEYYLAKGKIEHLPERLEVAAAANHLLPL